MENFEIRNHKILKNYSNFSPSKPTEKLKDGRYNSSATKVNESETSQGMRDEEKVMEVPIEGGERERERPSARLQKGRKGLQFARRRASSGQSLSLSRSHSLCRTVGDIVVETQLVTQRKHTPIFAFHRGCGSSSSSPPTRVESFLRALAQAMAFARNVFVLQKGNEKRVYNVFLWNDGVCALVIVRLMSVFE